MRVCAAPWCIISMSDQHFHPLISPFLILSLRAIIIKKEEGLAEWEAGRQAYQDYCAPPSAAALR